MEGREIVFWNIKRLKMSKFINIVIIILHLFSLFLCLWLLYFLLLLS